MSRATADRYNVHIQTNLRVRIRLSFFALMVGFASVGAVSAQEPGPSVMRQCGEKWQAAKAAGTTGNVAWSSFLSKCSLETRLSQLTASGPVVVTRDYIVSATLVCPGCAQPAQQKEFNSVTFRYGYLQGSASCLSNGSQETSISLTVNQTDYHLFFTNDVGPILDPIRSAVYQECLRGFQDGSLRDYLNRPTTGVANSFSIHSIIGGMYNGLDGYSKSLNGPWIITVNNYKSQEDMRLAQVQAQQRYVLQQQQFAQQKQAIRAKFQSDFGVQQYPSMGEVASNPFRFKGVIVSVPTKFAKMISENDAIFSDNRSVELFVSSVPSTLFRGGEEVVLAIRVAGTTAVKTPNGEATLPSGEYVGVYKCLQSGCGEYFD